MNGVTDGFFNVESVPIALALLAPLLAGVIAFSFDEARGGRAAARIAMLIAAGGAGWALLRALRGEPVAWQGFTADPWRALLAAGGLLTASAFMVRGTIWSRGALGVAAGAGAAAVFAPDALWLSVMLIATNAAYAIAAWTVADDGAARARALRSSAALVVADFVAVLGLILAAGDGLTLPPSGNLAPALLVAGGAIRLLAPAFTEDAVESGLGAAWLGPVRAHGALLVGLGVAGGGLRAHAVVALGSVMAIASAWRSVRERRTEPLATVAAGVAAAGLGLGGPPAVTGAVLAFAGSFAAWPLWLARRAQGAATPTFALAPAGAAFAGAVLVGGAALQAGAVQAQYLPAAVAVIAAAGLCASAVWRVLDPEWVSETVPPLVTTRVWPSISEPEDSSSLEREQESSAEPDEPGYGDAGGVENSPVPGDPAAHPAGPGPGDADQAVPRAESGALTPPSGAGQDESSESDPAVSDAGAVSSPIGEDNGGPTGEQSGDRTGAEDDEREDEDDEDDDVEPVMVTRPSSAWVDAIWAAPAIGVLLAIVALPERVHDVVAVPAAAMLGAGRLIGPDPFGVQDTPGVIMAVLAVLGLAAARGSRELRPGSSATPPRWAWWWIAPSPAGPAESVGRWALVAAVGGAATIGLAVRLLIVAASRGFL